MEVLPTGSVAAQLDAVQRSGEPTTVVLRQSRALLLSLTDDARRRLALLHPALICAVASAPVEDRFAACRVLVAAEIARLRTSLAGGSGRADALLERRLRRYEELLNGVEVLTRPDGTRLVRPHQLLAFDQAATAGSPRSSVNCRRRGTWRQYVPAPARAWTGTTATPNESPPSPQLTRLWPSCCGRTPTSRTSRRTSPCRQWAWGRTRFTPYMHQLRAHVLAAAYRDAADVAGGAFARDVEGLRMAAAGPARTSPSSATAMAARSWDRRRRTACGCERVVQIASAGAYVEDAAPTRAG